MYPFHQLPWLCCANPSLDLSFYERPHHHSVGIFYAYHKPNRGVDDYPKYSEAYVELDMEKDLD